MKHLKLKSFFLALLLTCGVGQMWANETKVVGVTMPTDNTYTPFINVNRDNWAIGSWYCHKMTRAGLTFEGKQLYIDSYDTSNGWIWNFQFQTYNNDNTNDGQHYSKEMWKDARANHFNKWIYDWDGDATCTQYQTGSDNSSYSFSTSKLYFDASDWEETNIRVVIGHASCQKYRDMSPVTGTKLYYNNYLDTWNDAMGFGIVGGETGTGDKARVGNGTAYNQWLTDVSDKAVEYTGLRHYGLNNNGDAVCYLVVNNGKEGEKPDVYYDSNYRTYLNATQTYNSVVKTIGGSYTSGNSKSTINISSYELTSQGGTTKRTPSISTSASSTTVSACRTATTQLQVGTPATGYRFDGWWTGATSGTQISSKEKYTYYPTSANTYYARFSEIARTVTVAYECGGTSIKSNGSVENVGVTTANTTTAPDITGYTFSTWSAVPTGVTTGSSLTGKTISINASDDGKTIVANYTLNSHTLTWDLDGGTVTTAGTCADAAATGTPNGSVNYGASITAPVVTKAGYTFAGWDVTPASTMPDDDVTYTAQWTEITKTVSFANDGNGTTSPNTNQTVGVVTGVSINATGNTGYDFDHWASSNGGTFSVGTTTASQTFTPTANTTLTAYFSAKTYTRGTLDKKGGSSDGEYSVTYNATSITIDDEPEYAGYQVAGYYLDQGYNYIVADAEGNLTQTVTDYVTEHHWIYDGTVTLYTKWEAKSYQITLSPELSPTTGTNGSPYFTVTSGQNNYRFGSGKDIAMTRPTKEGYTFNGYWTDSSGGNQIFNASGGIVGNVSGYTAANSNWENTDDDLTLYAHWTNNGTYVFKGGAIGNETSWSTAANWTKGVAPSVNNGSEDIIILVPVEIPASATTNVNSVRIGTVGSYTPTGGSAIDAAGKLTIPATAMLKVTTNVQNYNFSNSSATPTTESTLHIESASTGNGALVWGASGTPGRAQVDFYTKSSAAGNWEGAPTDVNQYIGTPFSDANVLYNYYNAWTFKVNAAGTDWERLKGDETMYPFVGYDVIYDGAAGHIFQMDGTLVTNENKTCTLSHTTAGDENLLANSWTAPIWIKGFEATDFSKASDASIYIFNSTSENLSAGDKSVTGGNYTAYTPGTSGTDDYIQSMQSFSVLSSGGAGSVTLNYTNLVLNPASHSHIAPMHAPRRFADGETEPEENLEPKMDFLRLRVADTNGWADELKIYIREDFVEEFENGFDARKMYGDPAAPTLYGISPDGRMAINCIPTADNHVVGFHGGSASNEYTFRFTYDGEDELYLRDNKTGIETPITAEDTYSFTTESGDNDLRFSIIRKTPAVPTDIETVTGEGLQTTGVQKIMYNGMLYILRSGRIYDATGALVK